MTSNILMLLTSHARIENQHRTGLWLEEFVVPLARFERAGCNVTVASPLGGDVPIDSRSLSGVDTATYGAQIELLHGTAQLGQVGDDFDAVFVPGGHGPMFDLASSEGVAAVLSNVWASGGVLGAVCHGPAALVGVKDPEGSSVVKGRGITAFSNAEEEQTGVAAQLPFALQTRLEADGGRYESAEPWSAHVVVDGNLVTGQNPASSAATAEAVLERLAQRQR